MEVPNNLFTDSSPYYTRLRFLYLTSILYARYSFLTLIIIPVFVVKFLSLPLLYFLNIFCIFISLILLSSLQLQTSILHSYKHPPMHLLNILFFIFMVLVYLFHTPHNIGSPYLLVPYLPYKHYDLYILHHIFLLIIAVIITAPLSFPVFHSFFVYFVCNYLSSLQLQTAFCFYNCLHSPLFINIRETLLSTWFFISPINCYLQYSIDLLCIPIIIIPAPAVCVHYL